MKIKDCTRAEKVLVMAAIAQTMVSIGYTAARAIGDDDDDDNPEANAEIARAMARAGALFLLIEGGAVVGSDSPDGTRFFVLLCDPEQKLSGDKLVIHRTDERFGDPDVHILDEHTPGRWTISVVDAGENRKTLRHQFDTLDIAMAHAVRELAASVREVGELGAAMMDPDEKAQKIDEIRRERGGEGAE